MFQGASAKGGFGFLWFPLADIEVQTLWPIRSSFPRPPIQHQRLPCAQVNMCYVPRFVFRNLHHSWKCYYLFVFLQEPKTQCENARDTFQEGASWCSRFPLFTRLSHRAPGMFALGFFHVVKSFFYFPRLVLKGFDFTTGNLSIIIFPFPGGFSKRRVWFPLVSPSGHRGSDSLANPK